MKKIISILCGIGIILAIVIAGCTKKSAEIVPQSSTQNSGVKLGNYRLSATEKTLTISNESATNTAEGTISIVINTNGSVAINRINVVGGSISNSITRISVTPSDKAAQVTSGGGCLSLSEATSFIENLSINSSSSSLPSQADICKLLDIFKCVAENPAQYGLSSSDEILSSSQIEEFCSVLSCPSCSALQAATPAPAPTSTFTFDGKEYVGNANCSTDEGFGSKFYSIDSKNFDERFTYLESSISGGSVVSVTIDGDFYVSYNSSDIDVRVEGNTTYISGKVKKSFSSSKEYNVSATIICR